jgi:aldehyde:ferredoxin oxidoreductase
MKRTFATCGVRLTRPGSVVACLLAWGAYTEELLATCLKTVGYGGLADNTGAVSKNIRQLRWKTTGFRPETVSIPRRFFEVTTGKGLTDEQSLTQLKEEYSRRIIEMCDQNQ